MMTLISKSSLLAALVCGISPSITIAFTPSSSISRSFIASSQSLSTRRTAFPSITNNNDDTIYQTTTTLFGSFLADEPPTTRKKRDTSSSELGAVAIAVDLEEESSWMENAVMPILSTALLITGNTVGASALVLPDIAAGPGLSASTMVFGAMFLLNLLSGLLIAEVSIKQYESSQSQVPSSFKEFAQANLQNEIAANGIASVSMFINACVLAFNVVRMGQVGSSSVDGFMDPTTVSICFSAAIAVLAGTLSMEMLSGVASMAVTGLFVTFGGLLLPGLASVHDPVGTFFAPGTSVDVMTAAAQAAPIVLTSMVYQNIVPSVTKILNYDRCKTVSAVALGSFLPVMIYLGWCFAVLGGGVDTAIGAGGPLMTAFSITTVVGSSIACVMSISEELETFLKPNKSESTSVLDAKDSVFSLPSVALSVAVPLAAGLFFSGGEDCTGALKYAGSYGSPLLYGAIPVAMAWKQRSKLSSLQDLVPGGLASLAVLGTASAAFMGEEFVKDISSVFA